MSVEMTSSSSEMITGDPFEAVEFSSDSDTDSWQVVDDPFDDVFTSDQESEQQDLVLDDVIGDDEDEYDSDDDLEDDVDDVIVNHTQELNEVYDKADEKAAVELDSLINGEGVQISDGMKEDNMYMEQMWMEHALDEEVHEQVEEDEDEDDYDDEEDLDDELVPRWLSNKFEKQRMRKLGKKVYPKMKRSNRMVIRYSRPGCAGAKQNLIW